MLEFATVLARNTQRNIFVLVGFMGVVFLIWFLVALLFDETRMRKRLRTSTDDDQTFIEPVPIDSARTVHKRTHPPNDSFQGSEFGIVRLSDRRVDKNPTKFRWVLMALVLSTTLRLAAQTTDSNNQGPQAQPAPASSSQQSATTPASPAPAPLTTPAITGPLQAAPPIEFDAGPLGKLDLDGIVSGMGLVQGNHVAGDDVAQAALSNGQVWIQKATGWWQFYVQAGAYNILALGTPFLPTDKAMSDLYGPVPVGFVKLVPAKNTSILIGALPTLMGAEYTFDFENMNIERGLLWNQENAVNRGIQLNQTMGKFTASISWNDGYYSNRYSWVSGSLTYTKGPHSLSFIGMGNLGQTVPQTLATPVQNNGSMYAVIYTYTKGNWIVQPYFQYSSVPTNPAVGVLHGAKTNGGAVLLSRTFKHGFSLAGRGEYIASTGSLAQNSVNLMYGPGSSAWSLTLSPTFQQGRFFTRGDLSFVRANSITPGDAFGTSGTNQNQPRGVFEIGFLF
jgi:hypothetical protein